MALPELSPSGSVLAVGVYVESALTTPVTVNTVELVFRLREKLPSVQVPLAAVVQVSVPVLLLNVPLTVAPETATPDASRTVAVTLGCHLLEDVTVVALSRSPMWCVAGTVAVTLGCHLLEDVTVVALSRSPMWCVAGTGVGEAWVWVQGCLFLPAC